MKLLKIAGVLVALAGLVVLAIVIAPAFDTVQAAQRSDRPERRAREVRVLAGRGAAIGVRVRDLEPAEADKQKLQGGVVVDDVRPDTPAEKAGIKRGDVIVNFDGETVRSARQFSRLVNESAPGRTIKATVVRDGHRTDVQVTPDNRSDTLMSDELSEQMRELGREMGRLGEHMPNLNFDFDFDLPGMNTRRLGVTVEPLTTQLAEYFGTKEGLLVTSVADGSSAAQAGLKAGDVITTVNGAHVRSRGDLTRELRDARENEDVTIGIVRDKKETSVKAKLEPRRAMTRRGRPA